MQTEEEAAAQDFLQLTILSEALSKEGFNNRVYTPNETAGLDTNILSIDINPEKNLYLVLSFFPVPEEDMPEIQILQLYSQYPKEAANTQLGGLFKLFVYINNRVAYGCMGLSENDNKAYYRHVMTLPRHQGLHTKHLAAVIDFYLSSYDFYFSVIDDYLTDKIDELAAIKKVMALG